MADVKPNVSVILKEAALFAALTDRELESLVARTVVRSYTAGELLFSEGDPCAGLYLIASGRVRIYKASPSGREQVLAVEGRGASIAELPVFDGGN
jgi:CRP/FNR family transcriptional regulator, cyclic AMP receptor protein